MNLEQIRARAAAATPGPWRVVVDDSEQATTVWRECESPDHPLVEDPGRDYVYDDCRDGELHAEPFFREADAEFIAHAREDIPALLAEIDRLNKRIDTAHDALTHIDDLDDDEFTTLESTVEFVVRNCRALVKDFNELYEVVNGGTK